MCKKHPEIPARGLGGKDGKDHLCPSCLAMDKFGKATMGAAAAGEAKK
jgi:hypothetical protein